MSTAVLTLLVVTAFAAAVVGRLRSLPLTYLGALILALSTQWMGSFLKFSDRWTNVPDACPTIMLFIVLLLLPRAEIQFARINAIRRVERVSSVRDTAIGMAALIVFIGVVAAFLSSTDPTNVNRIRLGMCTALVVLSLVPLTGWAGQVSLAPLAFAGIGAVAYARLGGADGQHLGGVAGRARDRSGRRAARVPGHAPAGSLPRAGDPRVRGDGRRGLLRPAVRGRRRYACPSPRCTSSESTSRRPSRSCCWSRSCSGLCGIGVVALRPARSGDDSSRSATAKPRR